MRFQVTTVGRHLALALAALGLFGPTSALAGVPATTLVTRGNGTAVITGGASEATMTPDARYVAFTTSARLVAGDLDDWDDVYVRDRRDGTVVRASVPNPGDVVAFGPSHEPSISADGRYVAFASTASNLVAGDLNGGSDIFVRDLVAGTSRLVSVRLDGTLAGPGSITPALSADGGTVAWLAPDFAVTPNPSAVYHLFARTLGVAASERVDSTPAGGVPGGAPSTPTISRDGTRIGYVSGAANIVTGDSNGKLDVFVRDRAAGTTQRASVGSGGTQAMGYDSSQGAISRDGKAIVFASRALGLIASDTNDESDVFVRDLENGQTARISTALNGAELTLGSNDPAIGDGRYVAFTTIAPILPSATPGDVILYDRQTGAMSRVSQSATGAPLAGGGHRAVTIGDTGRHVLFLSSAAAVAEDGNGASDGYLRDGGGNAAPLPAIVATPAADGSLRVDVNGSASSDPDGWVTAYAWSFGDGGAATGARGPHTFASAGRYAITLTVTDDDGATATATAVVDVVAAVTPPPPPGTDPPAPPGPPAKPVRCTILGTAKADVLVGTVKRDVMCGLGGNDRIQGRGGDDEIEGGAGADRLFGGPGRDRLIGGAGADRLDGGAGRDRLEAGAGNDVLFARDRGRDLLSGGIGKDLAIVDATGDTTAGIEKRRKP